MPSSNCEINLNLTWSVDCIISIRTGATKFAITDTIPIQIQIQISVPILSTQDNTKLLQKLTTINWNRY